MNAETLNRTSNAQLPALVRRSDPAIVVASRPSLVVPIARPVTGRRSAAVVVLRLAAVAVVVAAAWRLGFGNRSTHTTAAGEPSVPAAMVTVARPERVASGEVVLPATIRPWQTTVLYARTDGYLASWSKDLGATVKAGEVLATIETPELDQQVAEAGGQAQEAVVAVAQARAEREEAVAELSLAEAQLVRAKAEADLASSQLARRETLLTGRAISQEEYDTYRKTVDARLADVSAAEADVRHRRSNIETRSAIIAVREAAARSRASNVRRLEELQAFKRIVAPFDGVVTARRAEVGMLVTAGKDALFTVEDMSRVRVQVSVPQAYAARTKAGRAATLLVPETADTAQATVTRIAESVDSTNRTMTAEIELENGARRYQPGSYVQVKLSTAEADAPWTIPTNALQMRVDGPHVVIVDAADRLQVKRVGLGRDLGGRVVVVDGIRGDERLVVNPRDELQTGTAVRVATAAGNSTESTTQSAE